MKLLRKILIPIVPVYHLITWLRNRLYDSGVLKSKSYNLPVIAIGNLSAGGTGKTPMTEYVIKLLKTNHKLAVLSRGYGRKTKGFVLADTKASADTVGDEPFQFFNKFKDEVTVAVDEQRQHGIEQLLHLKSPDCIVLDDAYQHRKVSAGFYILLTTYSELYADDIVLPTGNLREPKSGAKRADLIVVTKCPSNLSDSKKQQIEAKLNLMSHQKLHFSTINYSGTIVSKERTIKLEELQKDSFTLVTGIADSSLLVKYLKEKELNFEHLDFKDHHVFSENELKNLKTKHCILTTEKDYMRLHSKMVHDQLYYLPIQTEILGHSEQFDNDILKFVENFKP